MRFKDPQEQLTEIKSGLVDLISEQALLSKLEKSASLNKPLRIKAGFDPNRPDLHLGHTVLINKLKTFQDFGHHVIFLIGDFTALIGDPTGKNETRPALNQDEIAENAKTYARQVFKILDPEKTEVAYNSKWMNGFSSADFVRLASQWTVARMLERDDFSKRYKSGEPISIHEFLYPLVQGYDSVALKADVELGGTDQLFNLLVGRELQKSAGQAPQCVLTVPILEGLDGINKMSKSLDNYIAVEDRPTEMFGKTMKISDELMKRYYELLSGYSVAQLDGLKQKLEQGQMNPRDAKITLAKIFVTRFHSTAEALQAEEEFFRVFKNKGLPDEVLQVDVGPGLVSLANLLKDLDLAPSTSEARRLMQSGGVTIDAEKQTDPKAQVLLEAGQVKLLKVGKKKFLNIRVVAS